jgi:hypothetical protein
MKAIRYQSKLLSLKTLTVLLFVFVTLSSFSQPALEKDALVSRLAFAETVPEGLLARRAVVLYEGGITQKDLEETQKAFQQTGIDAVAYFVSDYLLAGADPQKAFTDYLVSRNISFLILFDKEKQNYRLTFIRFSGTRDLVNPASLAWRQTNPVLSELLITIYRFALSNQKKQNFLVNDFPETDISIKYFSGRRTETYTAMVKSFKVAVPKFGNEKADAALEQLLKDYFPVNYELVDPTIDERELESKGFVMVLRFVHTRGIVAKKILDYDISQTANSIASVMVINGESQLKTIPTEETVYKFYIKHLEYGNIFLGNKWDADTSWQIALANHLQLMRQDLKY